MQRLHCSGCLLKCRGKKKSNLKKRSVEQMREIIFYDFTTQLRSGLCRFVKADEWSQRLGCEVCGSKNVWLRASQC